MEHFKRQSSSSFSHYDDCKRQKIQIITNETNCSQRKTISHFEDLSNEVIYEIFEFLDYLYVYEAFCNLNLRFHNLVTNSNLPIKINISSMSKSAFKRYNKDIIETNTHRIRSLHFSDVFIYNFAFPSVYKLSEFTRLEILILDNIESKCLTNILNQFPYLSLLSSLVITSVDSVTNKNTIYRQIFHLPALKYSKLSLLGWTNSEPLPVSTNEYSSIEHLIITSGIYLDELDSLLSYVPQLRHLSFYLLLDSGRKRTKLSPNLLKHLTHVSLKLYSGEFDQFAQLFTDFFPTVQVLRFTMQCYNRDSSCMNANKWKQLIITHIPNLRIFNIEFDISASNNDDRLIIASEINQFTTPFWIERQWFFAHQFYQSTYGDRLIFYSTKPYRRKHYTLHKKSNANTSLHDYESSLYSVQHVHIENGESIINCMNYFPNVTELIFNDTFSTSRASVTTILNRIIPLKQLTKLVITCDRFSIQKVIKILCCTLQMHTLVLKSMPCYQKRNDHRSIEESEDFQLVSNTNAIKNVTCDAACTLEQIKLLVALCPRLQYLTINRRVSNLESITRFLLDRTNQKTSHLCSLGFSRVWGNWSKKLDTLITSETLLVDYTIKQIGWNLYLWW